MTKPIRYDLLEAPGRYFDGTSARSRDVVVKFGDATLVLMTHADLPITHWALSGLRDLSETPSALTLAPDVEGDERLTVDDRDMIAAIRAVCPDLKRAPSSPASAWRKAGLWGIGALAAIYLTIFHLVPAISDQLATFIPTDAEIAMGEKMSEQLANIITHGQEVTWCSTPAGNRALQRMTARLEGSADLYLPLTVRVIDHELVNAFALPGGQIVIFEGLLRKAKSPEEVAGVLAHEIGHVAARDPTRLALRTAGTAGLIGILLGDFVGATATAAISEMLLHSAYRREAEAAADQFAVEVLAEERLPSTPFARFFEGLIEEHGETPELFTHLSSHPDLKSRAEATRAADVVGDAPFEPVLSDQEWVALRNICRQKSPPIPSGPFSLPPLAK